ncbi:Chromodomain Y-like protein [Tupaia chinensis]|uniref:Chromodomain Y-like protein n=1 Tax=Tupaia chinensis TaxID=246437 RepID=L9LB09_TUPCH|nr:Chromodomain Y-like protein [Tupaia chinensis]
MSGRQIEKIIDKRKNEKGKTEYLVQWKDYGSEEDTWEPVLHLKNCKDFTRAFNRHHTKKKRVSKLTRRCRASSKKSQENISRSTKTILSLTSPKLIEIGKTHEHQKDPLFGSSQNAKRNSTSSLTDQKTMEGKKTLVPYSPMKYEMVENDIQKESLQELRDPTEQCLDDRSVPLVAADKRHGALVGLWVEKLRMEDGLKIASLESVVPGPVPAAMVIDLTTSRKCKSPFPSELDANGTTRMQTPVMGVRAGKRKILDERTHQPSDKHLHFSLRQIENTYRYKDIVVWKRDGFTHILLSTKSSKDNSLNPR